jgi:hypothetical protein
VCDDKTGEDKMSDRRRCKCFFDDPLHHKAMEDATELDRVFFEQHPHRSMRVRKMLPRELPNSGHAREIAFYADVELSELTELILVYKQNQDVHVRTYCEFAFVHKFGPVPSDQDLDQMFPEPRLREHYPSAFWDELFQQAQASSEPVRELVH